MQTKACCGAHVGNFDACENCQIPSKHVAPLKKAHGKLDMSAGPRAGHRYGAAADSF